MSKVRLSINRGILDYVETILSNIIGFSIITSYVFSLWRNEMFFFWKVMELSELQDVTPLLDNYRSSISLLCIDDQGLEYEEILRKHDFNIKVIKDIHDIKAVSDYPIVICDIKGVGKTFGSQYEGGHVIEEIKKNYPEKVLIAYTGHQFDARYNKFFSMCDFTLTKDVDSDTWIELLDQTIKKVISPVEQWKRIRNYLYNNGVSTKKVFELEQEYINAIISKDKNKFGTQKTIHGLSPNVQSVINGFISSILFKLLIG